MERERKATVAPEHADELRAKATRLRTDPLFRPLGTDDLSRMFAAHFPELEDLQRAGSLALEAEGMAQRAFWESIESSAQDRFDEQEGWEPKHVIAACSEFFLDQNGLYEPGPVAVELNANGHSLSWKNWVLGEGLGNADVGSEHVRTWVTGLRDAPEANALRLAEERTSSLRDRVVGLLEPIIHEMPIGPAGGCPVCGEG